MAVVLLILKIIGIALLCVIGLVLLVLCLPAVISVDYRDKRLSVFIRAMYFIKIKVYPRTKTKPAKPKAEPEAEPNEPKKTKKFGFDPKLVKKLLPPAGKALRRTLSAISIRDVKLFWPVHSSDPARTAIEYGRTCAFFNAIFAALKSSFKVELKRVRIEPDFDDEYDGKEEFSFEIFSILIIILIAIFSLVIQFQKLQNSFSEDKDGERNRQSDSNDTEKSQGAA